MENFDLILEVINFMTYESCDEKKICPLQREGHRETWWEGGRQNYIVAVRAEVVWKQPTFSSGGRHRDSLLG